MAIATRTRPEMIVVGNVTRQFERTKKATAELYGHMHTVETATGGLQIATFIRDAPAGIPVGTQVALVVTVEDDPTYGSQLTYAREVSPNDLDLLVSVSGVAAKGH